MRLLLSVFGCLHLLLCLGAQAQLPVVTGRVLNRTTRRPLPGVTVVERGTTTGCSTDANGRFSIPGSTPDSLKLVVSAVGFTTRIVRVAAGSYIEIALDSARAEHVVFDIRGFRWLEIGFQSGLRYAPLGLVVRFPGLWYVQPGLSYQTDLNRNHALRSSIVSTNLLRNGQLTLRGLLEQQNIQAAQANLRFASYTGTLSYRSDRSGAWHTPELLLTAGYARRRPLVNDGPARSGAGYGVGFNYKIPIYLLYPIVQMRATRWSGYWEWQGQLQQPLGRRYQLGIAAHWLPRYQEINLVCTYMLGAPAWLYAKKR